MRARLSSLHFRLRGILQEAVVEVERRATTSLSAAALQLEAARATAARRERRIRELDGELLRQWRAHGAEMEHAQFAVGLELLMIDWLPLCVSLFF
jgi:hypothetical protein